MSKRVSYNITPSTLGKLKELSSYLDKSMKDSLEGCIGLIDVLAEDEIFSPLFKSDKESANAKPHTIIVTDKFRVWLENNAKIQGVSKSRLFHLTVLISHDLIVRRKTEEYKKALELVKTGLEQIESLVESVNQVCDDDGLILTLNVGKHYFEAAEAGLERAINTPTFYLEEQ